MASVDYKHRILQVQVMAINVIKIYGLNVTESLNKHQATPARESLRYKKHQPATTMGLRTIQNINLPQQGISAIIFCCLFNCTVYTIYAVCVTCFAPHLRYSTKSTQGFTMLKGKLLFSYLTA